MAGKATAQDLIDAGFGPDQFGAVTDWLGTFLPDILLLSELWARTALGEPAYDAATPTALTLPNKHAAALIRRAETYHGAAELWRRRAAAVDRNAVAGLSDQAFLNRREYLAHAVEAESTARDLLSRAGEVLGIVIDDASPGSALSVGHVESGRFPTTSTTAVVA